MRVDSLSGMILGFALCAVVCTGIEARYSLQGRHSYANRGSDWAYWPISALFIGNLTRAFIFGALIVLAGTLQAADPFSEALRWIHEVNPLPFHAWPKPVQFLVALGIGDFIGYWSHRLRHTRWLWPFHAIHHAPRTLDWVSAVRMHPIDDGIDNVAVGLALLLMGFSFEVWSWIGPFLLFFNAWLHLDVSWDLGALRGWVASPRFHRTHHERGRNVNFAGVFPVWDRLFGTYALGPNPTRFGVEESVPEGVLAGWWWPIRRIAGLGSR